MNPGAEIDRVSRSMHADILKIIGLPRSAGWEALCGALLGKATRHLAEIALTFDRMIADYGLRTAAERILTNWCRDIRVHCLGDIPAEGPLLIVSNHPGAYDALVIASQLPRPDLQIIASDLPLFRSLENFKKRIFFIPFNKNNTAGRMAGMLSAVRYLRHGGAVLLMGSGTIDPDPAVFPGALSHLQRWTEAVNTVIRFVPHTQVLLTTVSHIVHPKWARHPLTWLQSGGMEKRRLAEFGQVIQQLFRPGSLYVSPCVSFAPILSADELGASPRDKLLLLESNLLTQHCENFGGSVI